jgi:hypothetical protein
MKWMEDEKYQVQSEVMTVVRPWKMSNGMKASLEEVDVGCLVPYACGKSPLPELRLSWVMIQVKKRCKRVSFGIGFEA